MGYRHVLLLFFTSKFVFIISDVARSEKTDDLIVYTSLQSDALLTVHFQMNPVNNYTVYWSMDSLRLKNTNVRDIINGEHIQTSHLVSDVTNKQIGNYTVRIVNWAIESEDNEVRFNVILKLREKKSKFHFSLCNFCKNMLLLRNWPIKEFLFCWLV